MVYDVDGEAVTDLLRAGWAVHTARAEVYGRWIEEDGRFAPSQRRALTAAGILAQGLAARRRLPEKLVARGHAAWIRKVVGERPAEVPFAALFLVRLGDWVEAHTSEFLDDAPGLKELGEEERAGVELPSSLPPPPPFTPLEVPSVEAPGGMRFRFAVLGDLHFGSPFGEEAGRAAVADLNAAGVDLVIQLGDITDHGEHDEFELATSVLSGLQMPCVTMLGNHDVYSYRDEQLSGRERYSASFGRDPDGVIVEHKGFRFVVLDSAEHAASPFAPFNLVTGQFMEGVGGASVRGVLTPPQHDLLAEVAAPGAPPAFIFLHHPVQPFTGFPPIVFGLSDADSGRLHAVCDSGNVWGVFSGHTHRNARTRSFDGVPAHEVAVPRDYPHGFGIVDVADSGYAFRFVQLSDRDLVAEMAGRGTTIHRRYGSGGLQERAFAWGAPER